MYQKRGLITKLKKYGIFTKKFSRTASKKDETILLFLGTVFKLHTLSTDGISDSWSVTVTGRVVTDLSPGVSHRVGVVTACLRRQIATAGSVGVGTFFTFRDT